MVSYLNSKINKLQNIQEIALFWGREVWTIHFTFFCFLISQILLEGLKNSFDCPEAGMIEVSPTCLYQGKFKDFPLNENPSISSSAVEYRDVLDT